MKRLSKLLRENKGIAIIAVTVILIVAAMMGGTIVSQTMQDIQLTGRTFEDKQALYIAESAKEMGISLIQSTGLDFNGNIIFLQEPPQPGEENPGVLSNQQMPGGGTYDIAMQDLNPGATIFDPKLVKITATGNSGFGRSRRITVVAEVERENIFVFDTAIFGGGGASGGVIEGSSEIHGTVHLLGDEVIEGNNSIEAVDLSGRSLIHNNYGEIGKPKGMSAELYAKVPPLPTEDGLETLYAKLRVKNGAVGVSGNAEIGTDPDDPNTTPAGTKGSMDGIYIETDPNDPRWTGTATSGDPAVPDKDQVFSDNGVNALYNLTDSDGNPLCPMPRTDNGFKASDGSMWPTYDEYFAANSLQLPAMSLDTTCDAKTAVQNDLPANATFEDLEGCGFKVTQGTNTFTYIPDTPNQKATLEVQGMIQVNGDLVIGEKNKMNTFTYDGRATIYVVGDGTGSVETHDATGNITVHSDLLPAGIFPTDDVLGLEARNNIRLGAPGEPTKKLAAVFYAENTIYSPLTNEVAGTFVANYFDMGSEVPSIFQVPSLITNLPPGIIGWEPIWFIPNIQEKGWQADFPTDGTV